MWVIVAIVAIVAIVLVVVVVVVAVAAFDLLYTAEGDYLFLELNPVGQLGWLAEPTGLPLFQILARLSVSSFSQ